MRLEHWFYTLPLRLRSLFRRSQVEQELRRRAPLSPRAENQQLIAARHACPTKPAAPPFARLTASSSARKNAATRAASTASRIFFRTSATPLACCAKLPASPPSPILTLALGIGANSAIFSVVDAILLRPLPYPQPDRLVRIWESSLKYDNSRNVVNPFNFLDWRDRSQSFESMAAIFDAVTNLSSHGQPIAVRGMQVSPEFFSILRVAPFLGRAFSRADGIPGQDRSIILSYELWHRQFGDNRSLIGQKIDVDGVPCEVIGVMPKGFLVSENESRSLDSASSGTLRRLQKWTLSHGRCPPQARSLHSPGSAGYASRHRLHTASSPRLQQKLECQRYPHARRCHASRSTSPLGTPLCRRLSSPHRLRQCRQPFAHARHRSPPRTRRSLRPRRRSLAPHSPVIRGKFAHLPRRHARGIALRLLRSLCTACAHSSERSSSSHRTHFHRCPRASVHLLRLVVHRRALRSYSRFPPFSNRHPKRTQTRVASQRRRWP